MAVTRKKTSGKTATKKTSTSKKKPANASASFKPSAADLKTAGQRAEPILALLYEDYGDAHTALHHKTPLQLLVATILSAQCTDERVNIVTADLFKKYKKAADYAGVAQEELEEDIRSTGFYRNKARNIRSCCQDLVDKHKSKVPQTMEELTALAGVGRKTANCILGNCFNIPGVVTDTHVIRLSRLLGLSKNSDPVKLEYDLMALFPQKDWTQLSHMLIWHGRKICVARRPQCDACKLRPHCAYGRKTKTI